MLPGLELTYNDHDPLRAAHAVAVGLQRFVSIDDGIAEAIQHARAEGAAIIAAHPFDDHESARNPERLIRAFVKHRALRPARRFELFNRTTLFGWVSRGGLPAVATGNFHRLEHLSGWKTLLPCARTADAVVDYLRSPNPAYLNRVGAARPLLAA